MNLEKLMNAIAELGSYVDAPLGEQGMWIRVDKGMFDRMRMTAGLAYDAPEENTTFMGLPVKKSRVQDVWTLTIYRREEQLKTLKLVDLL